MAFAQGSSSQGGSTLFDASVFAVSDILAAQQDGSTSRRRSTVVGREKVGQREKSSELLYRFAGGCAK
jgi:hypothetical protein